MPNLADILESWFIICTLLTIWCIAALLLAQATVTKRDRSARD